MTQKNSLVLQTSDPFTKADELIIREALRSTKGDIYVVAIDNGKYTDIKFQETIDMMTVIINDKRCHIIPVENFISPLSVDEAPEVYAHRIRAVLPEDANIDKLFNDEAYGLEVAITLALELRQIDPERMQYPASRAEIIANPEKYLDHLHPVVAHKLTQGIKISSAKPLFSEIIDSNFLEVEFSDTDKEAIKAAALARNGGYDPEKLNAVMKWDVSEFDKVHVPAMIGQLKDKAAYSQQKGLRVLDMAIRMPGQGWAIPKEFEQFAEAIEMAVRHERAINPRFDEHYNVYITVDQKRVLPGKSQRRAGYHSDAYVTEETNGDDHKVAKPADNTYVVADALPTLYQEGPFPLGDIDPEDCTAVLKHFDKTSEGREPIRYQAHTVLKMTPYDIHTPDVNRTDEVITRTFIKIQFSEGRYNLIGNTMNPNLSYDEWTWVPRDLNIRNHRNSIVGWNRPDRAEFTEIYPYSIDFSQDKPDVSWAESEFVWARKTGNIHIEKAVSGEMLLTKHDDDLITINIAQAGDLKVTTNQGDQYFLSEAKFNKRYHPEAEADGSYRPMGTPQKMLVVKQPITLRAPWGAMQYVPAGSVITSLGVADMYAIHRDNYEKSYTPIDISKEDPSTCVPEIGVSSVCAFCKKCVGMSGQ